MDLSIPVDPLAELRRLYRQACIHQSAGDAAEAGNILRNLLPARINELRQDGGADDDTLRQVFAEEQRRVADAQALSEIVLPRLQSVRASAPDPTTPAQSPTPAQARATRTGASGPQSITDMLDSMLAQDSTRPPRR